MTQSKCWQLKGHDTLCVSFLHIFSTTSNMNWNQCKVLLDHNVRLENIILLTLFATPNGVRAINKIYPQIRISTSEIHPIAPTHFCQKYFGTDWRIFVPFLLCQSLVQFSRLVIKHNSRLWITGIQFDAMPRAFDFLWIFANYFFFRIKILALFCQAEFDWVWVWAGFGVIRSHYINWPIIMRLRLSYNKIALQFGIVIGQFKLCGPKISSSVCKPY